MQGVLSYAHTFVNGHNAAGLRGAVLCGSVSPVPFSSPTLGKHSHSHTSRLGLF